MKKIIETLKQKIGPAITKRDKLFSSPARTLNDIECESIFTIFYKANYDVPYLSVVDEISNYPIEYSDLIIRSWAPLTQTSIFSCNTPEMMKNKAFLAQGQADRGKLMG